MDEQSEATELGFAVVTAGNVERESGSEEGPSLRAKVIRNK